MARRLIMTSLLMSAAFILAGCTQPPFEPLTKSQAQDILEDLEVPASIVKLTKETQTVEEDESPSDSFSPNYNVSEKCEAVGRMDQLAYQSGWGTSNKQALPTSLRSFVVREGIKFSIETPDSAESYEYATLYVSLLAFDDEEKASEFMGSISSNVESCGDMTGEIFTFTLTDFKFVDEAEQDFIYEYIGLTAFTLSSFSIELPTFETIAVYSMGANVLAIAGSISEKGTSTLGVTAEDLLLASEEVSGNVQAAISALQ